MRYFIAMILLLALAGTAAAEMCAAVDETGRVIVSLNSGTPEQIEAQVQGLQVKPWVYEIKCGAEAEAAAAAWEEAQREAK